MSGLIANRYTGLFRTLGATPARAHDPDVAVWAGVPANRPWPAQDAAGGAGWTDAEAERACIGEAIERWQSHALATDGLVRDRTAASLPEAIDPATAVRFAPAQYALPGFPYEPLRADTALDWVRCRRLGTGAPVLVPAELAFMDLRPTAPRPRFGPTISTGWAAHATPAQALDAGIREVIERDAVVGAWWGSYPLVELDGAAVFALLGDAARARLVRPNLRWRWYAIATPYARHVTLATVEGTEREGDVFAIGSACRLDRRASLEKAALEAVQGRHYVRYLLASGAGADPPTTFAEHAVFYSRHPARRADTVLAHADRAREVDAEPESMRAVIARLPPAAFRIATPPALVDHGYAVVRVIVPSLQPLHGDHRIPFLGGALWNRPLAAYAAIPPHPFA